MKWDFFGSGLGILALGLTLMLALPPPWWPKMPTTLVHLSIVFGLMLVALGFGLIGIGSWPALPEPKGPIAFLFGGTLAVLIGAAWLFYDWSALHPSELPPASQIETRLLPVNANISSLWGDKKKEYTPEEITSVEAPITMKELFENDFNDEQTTWTDGVILPILPGNTKYTFNRKIFYNTQARSKFISIHLPQFEDAVGVAIHVAEDLDWFVNTGGFKDFFAAVPGNLNPTRGRDLIFSRVVYMYFDNILTSAEKVRVETSFQSIDVIVHIFESYYLLAKSYEQSSVDFIRKKRKISLDFTKTQALSRSNQVLPTPPAGT